MTPAMTTAPAASCSGARRSPSSSRPKSRLITGITLRNIEALPASIRLKALLNDRIAPTEAPMPRNPRADTAPRLTGGIPRVSSRPAKGAKNRNPITIWTVVRVRGRTLPIR